ncbi:AXH domain-containing protein [Caenorhabditis elegans]|uniref:AXH domain-containing protein n=1 Tax=Caenorhabditis elegans TaxID=6239 RepID=O44771_CAEEL|nr:AXH domain-containing protein [Caenorhabditis elegans]CCD70045.1 AXH domain-containing protein [Caenorhabditis elegans]|eukprot:NP_491837.2 Uncharacterized protein CELE_K04F10.1 [Caenorhabditis elegans]
MNFAPNQVLNPDLVQLLLASQTGNVNLWNPANFLLGTNSTIGQLPPVPQAFHFLPPLPPPITVTPLTPALLPTTSYPVEVATEDTAPHIKTEEPDPQPSTSEPSIAFEMGTIPASTYYPTHFMRGTQLNVANGNIKKVEDLSSDDFLRCAAESDDVIVNASVIKSIKSTAGSVTIIFETGIEKQLIPLKCQVEHPFFVLGKGWCSCNPRKSGENYGLDCEILQVDDVCIVLTRNEDKITDCAVDIVTAERDLELFSQRAALKEQLVDVYYERVSGRVSAPPERVLVTFSNEHRERRISE